MMSASARVIVRFGSDSHQLQIAMYTVSQKKNTDVVFHFIKYYNFGKYGLI